jgi:hypothetical protein
MSARVDHRLLLSQLGELATPTQEHGVGEMRGSLCALRMVSQMKTAHTCTRRSERPSLPHYGKMGRITHVNAGLCK